MRSRSVLLVGDDSSFLKLITSVLDPHEFAVHAEADLHSAFEYALGSRPDLVITDLLIEGRHAAELCRSLKSDHQTRQIPVLVMAAKPCGDRSVLEALDAGADDYTEMNSPLEFVEKKIIALMGRLRENKEAEKKLRQSEERYRAFVEQSSEAIWCFEFEQPMLTEWPEEKQIEHFFRHGYLAECNNVMAQMYGFSSSEQIIGSRGSDLMVPELPENIDYLRGFIRSGYRLTDAESQEVDKEGNLKHFLNNLIGVIEDGVLVRAWGTQRDMTEVKRLQEQLLQAEKLAGLGQLVSGVAHELNNPLTSVIGYTQLVLMGETLDSKSREHLEMVSREAERTRRIVQNLLSFSRQHKPSRSEVDLNDLLERTLELRAYDMRLNNISVQRDLSPIPTLMADGHQLQQVFLNIIVNAEQALQGYKPQGTLFIKSEAVNIDSREYVRVTIADDGPGIAPENLSNVFNPFFTTKEVGKGTGLGLSITYGIIKEHGGTITVKSSPGAGAGFSIELPVEPAQTSLD